MNPEKISARKSVRYSQNFLKNTALVQKLVERSSIHAGDTVLDIGAGTGIITEVLSVVSKKVIAIEADPDLAATLQQKFQNTPNVQVKTGDFLVYQLPSEPYKVFSNIPFNRTADVIRKLHFATHPPQDTYMIVQKEAAHKFLGAPRAKESLFSITIKPWFELSLEHTFLRSDFEPRPKIDTVLIRIKQRERPLLSESQANLYRDFVSYAYNRSNPNLKKGLRPFFSPDQYSHLSQTIRFAESAVPTQLSFEQWRQLFQAFEALAETQTKQRVVGSASKIAREQSQIDKVHRTRVSRNWKKEALF